MAGYLDFWFDHFIPETSVLEYMPLVLLSAGVPVREIEEFDKKLTIMFCTLKKIINLADEDKKQVIMFQLMPDKFEHVYAIVYDVV